MKHHESNCQFDSQPLKVENHFLLSFRWRGTYLWKALDKGYNSTLDLTSIKGLHKKLCASKVVGVPISGILGFPKQNDILVQGPWPSIDTTIRGKVVASPQFEPQ